MVGDWGLDVTLMARCGNAELIDLVTAVIQKRQTRVLLDGGLGICQLLTPNIELVNRSQNEILFHAMAMGQSTLKRPLVFLSLQGTGNIGPRCDNVGYRKG